MTYMAHSSHWLFHVAQADAFVTANQQGTGLTSRAALDLYRDVLRDPQPADWARDPMESLAVLTHPHPLPYEHWFLLTLQGSDSEAAQPVALEIADRMRRHRFFSSLAYGGRLQSLRWILEAPPEALDGVARVQRQSLLVQYPQYQALAQRVRSSCGRRSRSMPMFPTDRKRCASSVPP